MAPILYNGQAIGWIASRPSISTSVLPLIDRIADGALRNRAQALKQPVRPEEIFNSIAQAQEEFDNSQHRRRTAIVDAATQGILNAPDQQTVYQHLFAAIRNFYGQLKAVHLYEENEDLQGKCYRLLHSDGLEQRKESLRLDRWKTHLALAIEKGPDGAVYEPHLSKNDAHFVTPAGTTSPLSVYTLALRVGPHKIPAALQLQSDRHDFFDQEADRKAIKHLARLAGIVTVERGLEKEVAVAKLRIQSADDWNQFVAGILLDNTWGRFDILSQFQQVYSRLVIQLRAIAGAECIGSSIRLVNRLTGILGFVATDGPGFLEDRTRKLYPPHLRGAGQKALNDGFLYYRDVRDHADYFPLIPKTRSLWARRFEVHGRWEGVIAVDWKCLDGCTQEMDTQMRTLAHQFERVLEVLSDRQESLLTDLHSPAISDNFDPLVQNLKQVFGARACSLYLDRHCDERLTLQSTTDLGEGPKECLFGYGVLGWIAQHQKTVRVRNINNQEELDEVQNIHRVETRLEHNGTSQNNGGEYGALAPLGLLGAPLVARNRVLGVIRLTAKNSACQDFTHQDETFLQNIADRLARSLDAKWLSDDADERLRHMEQDAEFRGQLQKAEGLTDVSQMLCDQFRHRTQAHGAALFVSDEEESLSTVVASGVLKLLLTLQPYPRPPQIDTSTQSIWGDGNWIALQDSLRAQLSHTAPDLVQAGRSVAIPMIHARAVLVVVWQSPRHMRDATERQIADVKESLETALRAARLRKRQEETNEELRQLHDLATACASAVGLREVAGRILKVALDEAGMSRGTIRLFRGNDEWVLTAPDVVFEDKTPIVIATNYGLGRCLRTREPFLIQDSNTEWKAYLHSLQSNERRVYLSEISYLVVVPLWKGSDCIGALTLQSLTSHPLPDRQISFLKTLGGYAAVAIHSVQVNETEVKSQSDAVLGALVRGFSHVVRNKTNNALAQVATLETGMVTREESEPLFGKIRKNLERITEVCGNLMLLSSNADSGRTMINVNELFDGLLPDMPESKAPVTFKKYLDTQEPQILGNAAQIQTALRMLIQNGLEAMDVNGGELFYKTKQVGSWISIRVADTGVGMDKATCARCLEPFFSTKTKGSGLGLSVVLTIARRHHAELTVKSKPGKGTIWKLRFLRAKE